MKNIGRLCKEIPVCFPHELLGYDRDSVQGLLLSFELISNINMDSNMNTGRGKRNERRSRFNNQTNIRR